MFRSIILLLFLIPNFSFATSDSINYKRLTGVLAAQSAFYVAGVSYLQFVWYKDHERVPFHYYNDNQGWLQMDKAGHAYSAYFQSYISYKSFRWTGLSETKSVLFGGLTSVLIQTPIEIFDGLYEDYGFSKGDIIANTAGSLLFMGQQLAFHEQIVRMKFSYSPSPYAQHLPVVLGENHVERFFADYNGHTYWLSFNLQKISGIQKLPPWINLACGYSGNGMMEEFENPKFYRGKPFPEFERYRQYLFSLDVDFTRINTRRKGLKMLFEALNLIKIPFPAVEYNKVQGIALRGLYF
ncbi:MAG: DUF2279 domain-containing protein [Cytophagaceae bacterium]